MTTSKPLRVLFLDIDGVLNSKRTQVAFGDRPHDFSHFYRPKFDEVAITLIRKLCRLAGLSVVVSSSWKYYHSASEIAAGLQLDIMGVTPNVDGIRGLEIQKWLDEHPEVVQYAIVDDLPGDEFLFDQLGHLVISGDSNGLSFENFQKLCTLFEVNPYDNPDSPEYKVPTMSGWER